MLPSLLKCSYHLTRWRVIIYILLHFFFRQSSHLVSSVRLVWGRKKKGRWNWNLNHPAKHDSQVNHGGAPKLAGKGGRVFVRWWSPLSSTAGKCRFYSAGDDRDACVRVCACLCEMSSSPSIPRVVRLWTSAMFVKIPPPPPPPPHTLCIWRYSSSLWKCWNEATFMTIIPTATYMTTVLYVITIFVVKKVIGPEMNDTFLPYFTTVQISFSCQVRHEQRLYVGDSIFFKNNIL